MSQDNQQGVNNSPVASPSAQQQMIPKERLDEAIARARAAEETALTLQHVLRQAGPPQQPRAPEPLPPALERLKEENPALFEIFQQQELKNKQLAAANFRTEDNQDRFVVEQKYLAKVGSDKLNQVERKLEELRQQGNFQWTREALLVHMTGFDTLNGQAPRTPAPSAPPPAAPAPQNFAPSSDPSAAATSSTGTAPAGNAHETLEQMEARLATQII